MLCLEEEKEGMIIIIKIDSILHCVDLSVIWDQYLGSKYIEGRLKRKVGVSEKDYLVSMYYPGMKV